MKSMTKQADERHFGMVMPGISFICFFAIMNAAVLTGFIFRMFGHNGVVCRGERHAEQ